jgi:peptidoglycan/LPS O-acetylase OafA/YrhL
MSKVESRYLWIDWLRFIAAFMVMCVHIRTDIFAAFPDLSSDSRSLSIKIFYALTSLGNEAVLLFFILSGYLVGGVGISRILNNNFNLRSYTIDRITRIMTPLVPAIILTVAVQLFLGNPVNWLQVLGNLFALQEILVERLGNSNSVLWTLAYESWFYILVGGAALLSDKKALGLLILFIVALVFIKLEVHYLICWIIGASAYLLQPRQTSKSLILFAVILCVYGAAVQHLNGDSGAVSAEAFKAFSVPTELARIIFSAGIALALQQIILINSIPTYLVKIERVGTILAAFSYTLYLTHRPVIYLVKSQLGIVSFENINLQAALYFSMVMTSCLLSAYVMYLLFESNTQKIRAYLNSHLA